MDKYAALIVDLKKSRMYEKDDRISIQEYIYRVIKTLNIIFKKSIAKEVDFSGGDEIQGLFRSCESAYLFFRMFNMLISPVDMRAGIGVGKWDVIMKDAGTTAQDGRAYHNARYAIENAKDINGYSVLLYSDNRNDFVINSLINCTALILNKHSEYQNELMLLSELLYPIDVCKTIDELEFKRVLELLSFKTHINYYKNYFLKRRVANKYIFETINDFDFRSCVVDALNEKDDFFVTAGKKRGLANELSKLIGVSRQSIEKTIKTANIYEARNSTVAALKFMNMYL